MRVAVSTDDSIRSAQHGTFQLYTIVDWIENNETERYTVSIPLTDPDVMPKVLKKNEVDLVITGRMDDAVGASLKDMNIQIVRGFDGEINDAIRDYADGDTVPWPEAT